MLFHRVSLVALLALVACDEYAPQPLPVEEGAVLEPGRYDLLVRDVVAMACDADPGVMRGQVVPAELAVESGGVSLALGVWVLHGAMEPGTLHVEGRMGGAEPEPVDDEEVEVEDEGDEDDEGEDDVGGEDGDDAEGRDDAGGEGSDDAGEPVEGDVDVDEGGPPDREPRASALLDARIRDAQLAEGSLFLSMPGCEIELAVVLGRGGPGAPPDEPTRPPREDEPREGGSDGEDAGGGGSDGEDAGEPPREG